MTAEEMYKLTREVDESKKDFFDYVFDKYIINDLKDSAKRGNVSEDFAFNVMCITELNDRTIGEFILDEMKPYLFNLGYKVYKTKFGATINFNQNV